ncbi:B12-binding domain-containing radical SAM protein [Desulfolithobacter dissulfuricans]|uniref:B12-binding domain-containing radical SAM protein n=1 Tax=Desulfolithobacter dissulfuricans TaxID=2795293 RepID=A0A915U403_9BACT|nr:DUF4080 domain-containing protein [Desulfolithobacter dissulfuricans]BCO10247.1 B12-binding domain-containing radical SAM protein [Desulfolithobacter dissulfuricans]
MYHLVAINCRYSHSCLALFYIRNELATFLPGCRVRISQFSLGDPYYQTLLTLAGSGADAIFFSVYVWNHGYVRRLIHDLARIRPELPVVIGGPQAPVLTGLPPTCTLVRGEIEGVGGQFFRDLQARRLKAEYRAGVSQRFASPYEANDFQGELRHRQIYYESSRGCPFFCSYCLSSISRGVRHKPLDQVKSELDSILEHEPPIIKFVDRTFNDDPGRALAIWAHLVSRPGSTRCHFEIAPDRFTGEMHTFLRTVPPNRFQFEIGIQSLHPPTLAAVNRRMDQEAALDNIRELVALNTIHIHVDLILGLPHEDQATFYQGFNRLFRVRPHHIQMGLLKVLPGTEMAARAPEFGLVFCQEPPYEILATRWLDHETLRELYFFCELVEAFHNNRYFPSLWNYLARTGEDAARFFTSLLALARKRDFFSRARTQKAMSRLLFELVSAREDGPLLRELLRYDWLRCGFRYLPSHLRSPSFTTLRRELRLRLPQNLEGIYSHRERDEFLKKCQFEYFSGPALAELGLQDDGSGGVVAFLPEESGGVFNHCRVLVLPG